MSYSMKVPTKQKYFRASRKFLDEVAAFAGYLGMEVSDYIRQCVRVGHELNVEKEYKRQQQVEELIDGSSSRDRSPE